MATKSELERQVADLEAQLQQPPELRTIALSFTLDGRLANATSNTKSTPQEFAAQKAALEAALRQTDALLIQAVRNEERNATQPEL